MSLYVKDVMTEGPLVVVSPEDDLERAGNTMAWTRVRHLPVIEDGTLVGLLSERDVIRARGAGASTVRAAMRTPVAWARPEDSVESALAMMVGHNFGCLPVVSSRGLVGMLTTTDLLRHQLYQAFAKEAPPPARPAPSVEATFKLRVEQVAGLEFRVRFDKPQYADLRADHPAPAGGDTAPDPVRLLAASVGTCLCASLRRCLERADAPGADVKADVQVEVVRDRQGHPRVGRIEVELHPGTPLAPEAVAACLASLQDLGVVTESVRRGVDVTVALDGQAPAHVLAGAA